MNLSNFSNMLYVVVAVTVSRALLLYNCGLTGTFPSEVATLTRLT